MAPHLCPCSVNILPTSAASRATRVYCFRRACRVIERIDAASASAVVPAALHVAIHAVAALIHAVRLPESNALVKALKID